jgi:hypothetical protein
MAGDPLLSWQVRQWHHPASDGSLFSSKRTLLHMHPPVSPITPPSFDYGWGAPYIAGRNFP